MAQQLTIEAPDFDRVKRETGVSTRDAITTLWRVANEESGARRDGVRAAIERECPKEIILAPAGAQHDLDTEFATVLRFDGAAAFNLTGLQARPEPTVVYLVVMGAGTLTVKNENGSSLDRNRLLTYSGGDLIITTGLTGTFRYLNSRWREVKAA